MYSFYNVTFQGLGCAAWVREGGFGFFFLGFGGDFFFFWLFFLKNSTINVEFGTHLQKTAQSTNTEERGQFIPERKRDKRGQGEHKEERTGEGSPVVILLLGSEWEGQREYPPMAGGWTLTCTASAA